MAVELARLLLGILIALFHRAIATQMLRQERVTDTYFRRRGISLPAPPSEATIENLFFFIGIFVCLIETGRIWVQL